MPKLGDQDWRWMNERNISVVCDFRSPQERELAPTVWRGPDTTRHILADYDAAFIFERPFASVNGAAPLNDMHHSLYPLFVDLLVPVLSEMFEALLEEQVPMIFHCSAGQDRTGLAAGLLLSLLGVDRETILEDYLLSTQCRQFENELDRLGIAAYAETNLVARFYTKAIAERGLDAVKPRRLVDPSGNALLKGAFDAIEQKWSSVEGYLEQRIGIDSAAVARMRSLYLE
jgi:protein-tyrosine phosphatase